MKPRLVDAPPTHGDWLYELKFDGIRLLAIKNGKKIELISRNRNDLTQRFAELIDSLEALPAKEFVIDGEVVAVDDEGRSSFQLLQAREMENRKSPIYFYVFDLLQLNGKGLTSLPLHARKALLEKLCADATDPLRFSGGLGGDPAVARSETTRARRNHRQTARFRLRSGPAQRRVDQNQEPERTGVRHRRLHATARRAAIFRRDSCWLLRKEEAAFRRKSWDRFRHEDAGCSLQEIQKRRSATIVHSPICHQNKAANGCKASRPA